MHKIISFKKEIIFKNTIEEIVSISMDHHLSLNDLQIKGNFIVEGEYLNLSKKESFHFDIPYLGYLEENYDTKDAKVKIDDFYYEILEPNTLGLFIDILVDDLKEKCLIDEIKEDIKEQETTNLDVLELREEFKQDVPEPVDEIVLDDKIEQKETLIFKDNYQEAYMTYKVYIVREGDTIESILDKYSITLDNLSKYNVINELNIGDKLIISNEKNK